MAENNETNTNTTETETTGTEAQAQEKQTTFTLEEVTRLIQQEADKRVTQALKKQKNDFDKKMALSGMGEQERTLAEKDQTIAELNEKLNELNAYKSRATVLQALSEAKLPASAADVIMIDPSDEDGNVARVKALGEWVRSAVEEGVKDRLKAPGAAHTGSSPNKPDYAKMSDAEYYANQYKKK